MLIEEQFMGFLSTKKALGENTLRNHRLRIGLFIRWLEGREITKDVVQSFFYYLNQRDQKNGTYNAYVSTIRMLDELFTDQGTPKNLMTGYRNKKADDTDPIQILSLEDVKKLLSTNITFKLNNKEWVELDRIFLLFTRFLYFSACRVRVEGIALKVGSYDPGTNSVWFIKTKTKKRKVFIKDPYLQKEIPKLMVGKSPTDFLFTTPSGRQIDWTTFWANLKKRARIAGISQPLRPHALRHSQASHLYRAGVPLELVSLILGHANVGTTFKTYVHVNDDPIEQAMSRSPLLQESVSVKERIKDVKKVVEGLKLDADERMTEFNRELMMLFLRFA